MDGHALAWKWPSALASRTLPCGPCPHDPTGVDSRPSMRPRPCGPRPPLPCRGGLFLAWGLFLRVCADAWCFQQPLWEGRMGAPPQGPSSSTGHSPIPPRLRALPAPPMLQPHRPFAVSPGPGHPFVPSALTMSRLRHRPQVGCSGSPRGPAPALLVTRPHHCPVSCMRTEPCPSWSFRTPSPAATRDTG